MEMLDRMELADIGHPRKLAEAVTKQIPDIQYPIPIESIAMRLGIRKIEDFTTTAFEGALLANESKSNCAILIRAGVIETRRRFTIGHELGHYLMPLHFPSADGFRCSKADMNAEDSKGLSGRPLWEAQANDFSSELLMPQPEFKRRLRKLRGASIEALVSLSDDFGVSKTATGRRMLSLAEDPCAVVLAKNGQVERIYRAPEFPFISLRKGLPMPRASAALRVGASAGDIGEVIDTDQCHWLAREKKGAELYEQTLFQADGWTLTLLTAEIEEDEDDE